MFLMIILLYVLIMCIVYIFSLNKSVKRVLYLYLSFTFLILGLSVLNLHDLYEVDFFIYLMWITNTCVFLVTILFFLQKKKEVEENNEISILTSKIVKSKWCICANMIIFILLLYYRIKYNNVIANLDISQIRMARFDKLFNSGVEAIFFDYILVNLLRVSLMISSVSIVEKKYINWFVIISIINLFIYVTIGYGRMMIFEFIMYVLILFCIYKPIKLNLKTIIICLISVILLLSIATYITSIRMGNTIDGFFNVKSMGKQVKQTITYFTGGFIALENFLEEGFSENRNLTLGRATIGGIEDILGLILNNIGFNYNTINSYIRAKYSKKHYYKSKRRYV